MNLMLKYSDRDILAIAENEHGHHSKANLIDYYKLFFQSYFGQGHFIGSESETKRHLENELAGMKGSYLPLLQDISNGNGLYRISLEAVRSSLISKDELLLHYLNSIFIRTDWEQWAQVWSKLLDLILAKYPKLKVETDLEQCFEVIQNRVIMSHSECFRLTYSPHYRVMQLSESDLMKYDELRKHLCQK